MMKDIKLCQYVKRKISTMIKQYNVKKNETQYTDIPIFNN